MARFDCWVRRLVGTIAVDELLRHGELARLAGRVLCVALFLNYPHYMATLYRAYHNESDFRKYRLFTIHITGLVVLTVILTHFWYGLLPWIFTLYLTWSPWHYTGQNYGLFMMYARRAGPSISGFTKRILYSAFVLSYVVWFVNLHTGASDQQLFVSLGIPAAPGLYARLILGAVSLGLAVVGFIRLHREIGWTRMVPAFMLFSTQAIWFLSRPCSLRCLTSD